MKQRSALAVLCAAVCLAAALSGCTSERGSVSTADVEEVTTAAETEAETTETEATTTEAATTAEETDTTAPETGTTEPAKEAAPGDGNIFLTHITEGGEGLGVFNNTSGNVRGEVMQAGSVYKSWKLVSASGKADEDDTVHEATAEFEYGDGAGFSVNGTVEVLPASDPKYPNKMYFHSDDVDAFPKYMDDNRGEENKAKFVIENSSEVYKMLDKDDPPAETAFSVSVTVSSVTVRYTEDGSAYDTIIVTAASNR